MIDYMDYEVFENLINADYIHDNGLFFGNHHYDISNELLEISVLIKEYLKG